MSPWVSSSYVPIMYRTRLSLSFAALVILVLFLTVVLVWGINRAGTHIDRSAEAHAELETFLTLSAETYRLFKQFRKTLLNGESASAADVAEPQARLEARIEELQQQIDEKMVFVLERDNSAQELSELERQAILTGEIHLALGEVRQVQLLHGAGRTEEAVALLTTTLEERIDRRFGSIIDASIVIQRDRVRQARSALDELITHLKFTAEATAVVAVLFAFGAITLLLRGLSRPLDLLTVGTLRLADGDLAHRIAIPGSNEFSCLGDSFNKMAADLETRRDELERAQRTLETKVEERTVELTQANEALKRNEAIRQRFFADISHELRTPLTVIRGEAEVALRGGEKPIGIYRDCLGRIVEQSEQLRRLVADLFLIARTSAGVTDLRASELSLGELVEKVCHDATVLAKPKGIDIDLIGADSNLLVMGDAGRLRQLMTIVLDNAIRYSQGGGQVEVRIARDSGDVRICFEDSGPGIPPEDLEHIFDRFYRGESGRRRAGEGSGLGLPLAKSIAEAHGGKIVVESNPDRGTRVSFALPLLKNEMTLGEERSA